MSLRFNGDGTFRVLQMADIQDGPHVREDTIRLIDAAIRKAHPDLIVFTGDQIRGYDPAYIDTFLRRRGERPGTRVLAVTEFEARLQGIKRHPLTKTLLNTRPTDDHWMIDGIGTDSPKLVKRGNGTINKLESWAQSINQITATTLLDATRQKVRDTFAAFLGPALEARIPFAATYGNHDFQCGILADEQDGIYREFSGCMNPVAGSSPLALEPGTFALPIESSDGSGRIAMSVMMVNSGDYADADDSDAADGTQSVAA
ncbi:MAG TPA: metallophosphatase, partial [Bifidobacterium sp.]|nr:metallophosphatase [Bifidobacterium sp.]